MDQQILWDDFLNSVDTQNLPVSPVFPSDTNMPRANPAGEESADLRMWSSGGPSSSRHPLNPSTHEETKMQLGWPSSLTIHGSQGSATEERHLEATDMFLGVRTEDCGVDTNKLFSMEDVNLNLNSNQADSDQLFSENLSGDNSIKHSDQNAGRDGTSSRAPESAELLHPNSSRSLGSSHVSSSGGSLNLRGSSSSGIGFLTENFEGRSGSSLDDLRMSRKRKNIEGVPAQGSAGRPSSCLYQTENSLVHSVPTHHSYNTSLNISSSSNYPSGINPSVEQLNPRISTNARLGASDFLPFNVAANAESSQRNCRFRINPPQDGAAPPSSWLPGNSLLPSGPLSTHQPSLLIPFTRALDSRVVVAAGTSETQPLVLPTLSLIPNMQPLSLTGASSSRAGSSRSTAIARQRNGSSTRSAAVAVQRTGSTTRAPALVQTTGSSRRAPPVIAQRSSGLREDSSSRSTSRNTVSENTILVPAADVRNSVQDPASWGLANGSIAIGHVAPVSQSVTPTQVQQLPEQTWIHRQNAASHYQRLAEVGRSSFSPDSSGSSQAINLLQRSANSNTPQEMTHQSSGAVRGHLRPYARSALSMDRHSDGVLGIPLRSLASARDGRNRVLSEQIRNAMQLARRGENLHLEDILLFDHSVIYGGAANLHDRHRDLRLDVDNMSYEELLALGERIGNVSTGLTEETVLKFLKQRKYISLSEETPTEVEPCCVCQEEYVEGEDVGRLNCGHDFHTACIKQWLLMKNLCPICKTTGLDTEKHKKESALHRLI